MGSFMPLLWTISPRIRSIAAPYIFIKAWYKTTCDPDWIVEQVWIIPLKHTFVTPTDLTSTDRLPWTTSRDALEIGPVQRCCNRSLAWSLPNSTSRLLVGCLEDKSINARNQHKLKFIWLSMLNRREYKLVEVYWWGPAYL